MSGKSNLKIVMGAMTFGEPGKDGARVTDLKDVKAILDAFVAAGHSEVDTARFYTGGTSEEYLGKLDWQNSGLIVETKLYPAGGIKHTPEGIREHLGISLAALKAEKLELFYLHGPDRSTPWEVTFKALDELHKEGKFKRLGISNYASWEVAEIVTLCRFHGWIQPTVYQGIYNALHRGVEPELFPCLRKFGISFYEFNPLCGGWLTGRYKSTDDIPESGARFDTSKGTNQSRNYRKRYWNEPYFRALAVVEEATKKHNLSLCETALRWVNHHSEMKREYGDAIIIGASSLSHIQENLKDFEKGPLPADVVEALDQAWEIAKPVAAKYFH